MTVAELIEALQKVDQTATVCIPTCGDWDYTAAESVGRAQLIEWGTDEIAEFNENGPEMRLTVVIE